MACFRVFYKQQGQELAQVKHLEADTLTAAEQQAVGLLSDGIRTGKVTGATLAESHGVTLAELRHSLNGWKWVDTPIEELYI